ncbi:unnamed protein product [Prorocentrum cordatum]|uniref:EGF-like domain-containing protein n=1 Tax=Prorocentrum cordatum TaxID=2364126 RepID=A0ABN9Q569_9DINO|nr:unnamed protein product [Polarella glacialis]
MVSFYGKACDLLRCPLDCSGRGRCEEGRCSCAPGFQGEGCEAVVVPAPIWPTTLHLPLATSLPTAESVAAEAACPGGCGDHGRCEGGACTCCDGYSGASCQDFCPSACSGRGACTAGRCLCLTGYSGDDCSAASCCSGHGDCPLPGECVCHPGWAGADCSEQQAALPAPAPALAPAPAPALAPAPAQQAAPLPALAVALGARRLRRAAQPATLAAAAAAAEERAQLHCADWDEELGLPDCSGRGQCAGGVCSCPPGWGQAPGASGPNTCAERLCLVDCGDHGVCEDGRCTCHPGWHGERCSQAPQLGALRGLAGSAGSTHTWAAS